MHLATRSRASDRQADQPRRSEGPTRHRRGCVFTVVGRRPASRHRPDPVDQSCRASATPGPSGPAHVSTRAPRSIGVSDTAAPSTPDGLDIPRGLPGRRSTARRRLPAPRRSRRRAPRARVRRPHPRYENRSPIANADRIKARSSQRRQRPDDARGRRILTRKGISSSDILRQRRRRDRQLLPSGSKISTATLRPRPSVNAKLRRS